LAETLTAAYTAQNTRVSTDIVACDASVAHDLLAAEQVHMAFVSEMGSCQKGADSPSTPLALDAVAVIVSRESALHEMESKVLSALFGGYHLDWQPLSGSRGQPELVVREAGSTARELFDSYLMDGQTISSAATVMPHDRAVLEHVAEYANAVGYISKAYVDDSVRALAIDGVSPTQEAIRRGEYPLIYCLRVKTSGAAPREARQFLAFMGSRKGKRLVAERYVIPD
jgi:phosphate transport system substrate-binding protein